MTGNPSHLGGLLAAAALQWPDAPAVEDESGRVLTYRELDRDAGRVAAWSGRRGLGRGDRVGLFLPKSIEAVAAIHGILRAGAAYVPVDPNAPAVRGAGILADAGASAIVVDQSLVNDLANAWPGPGPLPPLVVVGIGGASEVDRTAWDALQSDATPPPLIPMPAGDPDDLAYVLYTSGSTGKPKGVTLSHINAFCFLDWCESALGLRDGETYSSHAPFHFDLSIFDLYASVRRGGRLVLIGESLAKDPARLGRFVSDRRIQVWYSAPSILALMAEHGGLDNSERHAPRVVLFAGEVFPIRPLRRLRGLWPDSAMWNLYGPTETNVCTAYAIPSTIPEDRVDPYPIGPACPPLRGRVVDSDGFDVPAGSGGELVIAGPGVTRGYAGRPDLDALAFFHGQDGTLWYRTGDLVVDDGSGSYVFRGRRDRMVKKRGYRIELGEIESALYRLDDVERAAVVASSDESGVTIDAYVAMKPDRKASIIAMKRHCTSYLPHYMVPDRIRFLPSLPSTSTDKVDYQRLKTFSTEGAR